MATLILTQPEIRALLPMQTCMELVADALCALARGAAQNPLRRGMRLADGASLLGMMPGSLAAPEALGLKVVTVFPGNHGTPYDSHQGVVVLFDPHNGTPRAILDASEITALRTAAASGVATRALAREDAGDLALLGSGVQARTHLEAMGVARRLRRVRVYSRSREKREEFAARESERHGLFVEAVDSARAAVEGADLVCTTTSATEPVLLGRWLRAGAHVNAAGACVKHARELDTEAVRRARLFVDRRESALNEAGDLLIPMAAGELTAEHVQGELGEVLLGSCAGRRSAEEITLFESLGLAVEDLAAARYLERVARERGLGQLVELGGLRVKPLEPIPLGEIRAARERISGSALCTPLLRLDHPHAPAEIWLKLENLQPIGSFKLRGAGNAMARAGREVLASGVYTASAGNMAQGVAWNARRLGIPCTVVAPESAPRAKLDAVERLGARLVLVPFERWWQVLVEHRYPGIAGLFLHPVSDPAVIAGNGSIGLELLEDLPSVDAVVVPYGGGGLACGIASALRALRPEVRVFAAEVEGAAPLSAALAAGAPRTIEHRPSFVDGIGGRSVLAEMWPMASSLLAGSIVVSVAEVAAALRHLVTRQRVVAEGAGAAAVAAALTGKAGHGRVACIVSGGNIDAAKLIQILAGEVP